MSTCPKHFHNCRLCGSLEIWKLTVDWSTPGSQVWNSDPSSIDGDVEVVTANGKPTPFGYGGDDVNDVRSVGKGALLHPAFVLQKSYQRLELEGRNGVGAQLLYGSQNLVSALGVQPVVRPQGLYELHYDRRLMGGSVWSVSATQFHQ